MTNPEYESLPHSEQAINPADLEPVYSRCSALLLVGREVIHDAGEGDTLVTRDADFEHPDFQEPFTCVNVSIQDLNKIESVRVVVARSSGIDLQTTYEQTLKFSREKGVISDVSYEESCERYDKFGIPLPKSKAQEAFRKARFDDIEGWMTALSALADEEEAQKQSRLTELEPQLTRATLRDLLDVLARVDKNR